ncbi:MULTISPECIES: SDR family NAD(P)-dependent oxidoreductase [Staphylococcus]|jgi:nucleoside-diphosphate-sugar epimerase|uniref:Epimerase n=1 Tax=Staphylococcus nepalensis TaxID=214473 RepID=A0A2T4S7F1_9STAP|nr:MULTISPECIES: SDR family NAD(P)-dependent oxidoreductase [Staphylococcus]VDG66287.1 NAD-dependent epimerase/dehydratase [Lacrimispora indolis]MBO1205672.1 SDR family NAD(P)-dependent oxidoreductase [Staphylococcus nepalensis]MBO1212698.1 SDR family NAD(P)-dependent oxidoreductase [Staphylococcus nepalensis]MBO1215857.1 SDR family NAD(P)-dependent oxidoreductase [Staphylococcus nepalensis]MBO1226125.1 SDR family NAD(P)-dependent oxidoreductase [Staphylococcus nepalensis]
MNKVIVLGATGGTGQALVYELLQRNIQVIAFGRSKRKLETLIKKHNNANLTYALGDIFNYQSILEASENVDIIFQCANVPYQEMKSKLPIIGENVMQVADKLEKKIVIIDGIYVYGRQCAQGDENHPKLPNTKKGAIRLQFENLIFDKNKWTKAKPLIVRLPDYFGPSAQNTYLQPTIDGVLNNKHTIFIGNLKTSREYIYLPDAAKMIVNIAEKETSYEENWNIPGSNPISGKEIIHKIRKITNYKKRIIPLNKLMISLIGRFNPFMREIIEMMYITKEGFILNGDKYQNRIGPIVRTDFDKALKETLNRADD